MIALSVERATQPRITSPGTCSFTYCLNSVCMLCGKASRSRSLGNKHMTSVHVLCPVNLYVMWQSITEPPPKKQTHDKCTCPLSCKSVCYVAKPYRQKPSCSQWGWLQLGRHILETHELGSHGVLEKCCICKEYFFKHQTPLET